MKSSVRFNSGGSGSFVSANGLVMTNHHVAADAIQKLSGPGRDLITTGYIARKPEQELRCVDLELNVLQSIEDVTTKITSAAANLPPEEAEKAKRAAINTLEQEESKSSGLRCDVVTLFKGGAFHLYRYKRYDDVRLVFAPEIGIAFFGGDSDNFEYPRQCLDVTFFRVYEDGKPVKPSNFLKWAPKGITEGDLVFVSGHPGRTNRLNTTSHLRFFRDTQYPYILNYLRRAEVLLNTYSERSAENRRQAQDEKFGVQNSRKARLGGLQGLQDPAMMQAKKAAEEALRAKVAADPKWQAEFGSAWPSVDAAVNELNKLFIRYAAFEQARAFNTDLFHKARLLVRRSVEQGKPNAQRLREFGEAHKSSLEQDLFSAAPHYTDFEIAKLADSLALMMEMLGGEDPWVAQVLAGKSPRARAEELVRGSRLAEVDERKRLAGLDAEALKKSSDPMIALAWLVDGEARRLRQDYEKKVTEPMEEAYAKIARAQLASAGQQGVYPDATFTLRLAFGKVAGYAGIPFATDIGSLFSKSQAHAGQHPYNVPVSWQKARPRLNLKTPYNFVCTADIIGGNSGSPVVDRQGEVVGLIFDGNIESLVLDFAFSEERARALAVDARAIIEALRKVYQVPALADELQKGR